MDIFISVIVPTYNRISLTDRAINSVISKRPELVEVIVVDDCGTQPYTFQGPYNLHGILVRVIRVETNKGPGIARAVGVAAAKGALIAFLDSDDVFTEVWIDALVEHSENVNNSSSEVLFLVGKASNSSLIVRVVNCALNFVPNSWHLIFMRAVFMFTNSFHTPSIAMSRQACFFNEQLRYCEDFYTNATAIFCVTNFRQLDVQACVLFRKQGSVGGESHAKLRMFFGELTVRSLLFRSKKIPIGYKFLVPLGVVYQVTRDVFMFAAKTIIHKMRGRLEHEKLPHV